MSNYIVQVFLPIIDNEGAAFSTGLYDAVKAQLTEKYGGLTIYGRAPAKGLWKKESLLVSDELVIFEVMTAEIDIYWWAEYRTGLEHCFNQDVVVIRASPVILL